jgi:uncharacterized protein (TIGR03000 family)
MKRQRLSVLWLLVLLPVVLGLGGNAAGAAQGGHGGGAGHAPVGGVGPGFGPRVGGYGYGYGRYGRGCWDYPGWCGFGLGLGLGYGLACDYPWYPDAYGYPVYVPYPYPYPYPPAGPVAVQGSPAPSGGTDVVFDVRVPPDASVWINGIRATQTGPQREFVSAGLTLGRTYTFTIDARWTGPDGKVAAFQQRLTVQGGDRRTVDFTTPAAVLTATPTPDRSTH